MFFIIVSQSFVKRKKGRRREGEKKKFDISFEILPSMSIKEHDCRMLELECSLFMMGRMGVLEEGNV